MNPGSESVKIRTAPQHWEYGNKNIRKARRLYLFFISGTGTRYWVYFFKHHRAKISLFALTRQMSTCLLYFVNAVPSSAICYQFSPRIHSAASLLPGHPRHACDPGYGPPVAQARCWPQRQEPVWRNPAGALCLLRQRGLHQTALGVGSTFRFIIYSNAGNS